MGNIFSSFYGNLVVTRTSKRLKYRKQSLVRGHGLNRPCLSSITVYPFLLLNTLQEAAA